MACPAWLDDGPGGGPGGLIVGYAAPPEHAFAPTINALISGAATVWG